jgi:integrase
LTVAGDLPRRIEEASKRFRARSVGVVELTQSYLKGASLTGHVIEWDGEPIKCIRKAFVTVCERAEFGKWVARPTKWVARPTEDDPKRHVFLSSVTPHVLRHTAISWMEEAGIPMSVISRFAGHDDENTTRKIYWHPRPGKLMKRRPRW